jgi:hypothetical protein
LPALAERANEPVHQHLFFDGDDGYWFVRSGEWKLVSNKDIGKFMDLAVQHQSLVIDLHQAYQTWRSEMGHGITAPGDRTQ